MSSKRQKTRPGPKAAKPKPRPRSAEPGRLFEGYKPLTGVFDELFEAPDRPRPEAGHVVRLLDALGVAEFRARQQLADVAFRRGGVTFSVYSDAAGVEKVFPFDLVPRTVEARDWERLEAGLVQRVQALNAFIADIYGDQRILAEGKVPRGLVEGSKGYRKAMRGIRPPGGVYTHIAGIDLVRRPDGRFAVLEDNIRTPSGVSYVLENRVVMKRIYPGVFERSNVRAVDEYPMRLRDALVSLSPRPPDETRLVVLTPGQFNSAYFEHSFLARRMGVELVQGQDLFVHEDHVYVKTTQGPERVDVIYRRVDDEFLDPDAFLPDSLLGVRGLVRAYARGNVTLANAIGNGVADDKAIYPFVPEMIRFYLSAEPLLEQVETHLCWRAADLGHVLANLDSLVVKLVDGSGGYGMLFGPKASDAERAAFAKGLRKDPRGYIAQPVIELSTCPTWNGNAVVPRRVDLRPFVVTGRSTWALPGGLTRVALVKGSYVVNSSQGGGAKDTWVLSPSTSAASTSASTSTMGGSA